MADTISTREAYGEVLVELGEEYKDLYVLDADLSKSTNTSKFGKVYKDRFINVGIAEQNMMGMAAGLALAGKIPVASTFAVFATLRSGEQVRTSIAYPNLNVKIVTTHSGLSVGTAGATHFSEQDIAVMRSIPNMTVIAPADAAQTKKAVRSAVEHKGPVYIRLGRGDAPVIYDANSDYKIGKAITLVEGNDISIIASGIMVGEALKIGKELASKGVNARVLDMHTIKPIDRDAILKAAAETRAIITIEEHNILGGLGSAVSEVVCDENPVIVKKYGIPDIFCGVDSAENLWVQCGICDTDIVDDALKILER